jgi:HAD superfamily hydrolase (TIGR01509 family)
VEKAVTDKPASERYRWQTWRHAQQGTVPRPRSIIFDLGGVYFTDGTRIAIASLASRYHLAANQVEHCLTGALGRDYRLGRLSGEEFWRRARAEWHIEASAAELAAIWCSSYQPIMGTVELVKKLRGLGHELLFLSDNTAERVHYLNERYDFLGQFKEGVFSHVVGRVKPDPALYELVLARASHPATECVYIDNKVELLEPARALGMSVIAFENPAQLELALQQLGLFST